MKTGSLIAVLGGWSVVLVAISTYVGRLFQERLLSKWRLEEQKKLEILRSDLARNSVILESAIKSFAAGQVLYQKKRQSAAEILWTTVIKLREQFAFPVFFFSIFVPSEYDRVLKKESSLLASINKLTHETIETGLDIASTLEINRPYFGETLWSQFFIYRAFLGRLAFIIIDGKTSGHIDDWRADPGVKQLLSAVLPTESYAAIMDAKLGIALINRAVDTIESLMLKEIALTSSGKRSASESYENASQMIEAIIREKIRGTQPGDRK
jgi:hypothetical protein